VLKEQTLAGRLTVEELGDRVAGAYQARTIAELSRLTADLPDEPEVRAQHEAPAPRMPGNRPFSDRFEVARARGLVMAEALAHIAPPLHNAGYELTRHSPDALEFTERAARGGRLSVPSCCSRSASSCSFTRSVRASSSPSRSTVSSGR
jgi:hypothetical protein